MFLKITLRTCPQHKAANFTFITTIFCKFSRFNGFTFLISKGFCSSVMVFIRLIKIGGDYTLKAGCGIFPPNSRIIAKILIVFVMNIVRVALAVPLPRFFDYLYPPDLTPIVGGRVLVPLVLQNESVSWWICQLLRMSQREVKTDY